MARASTISLMEHRANEPVVKFDVERNEFGVELSAMRRNLKLTPAQRHAQQVWLARIGVRSECVF